MRVAYRYIRPLTVVYARSIGPYAASSREAWRQMNAWLDRAAGCAARSSRAMASSATTRRLTAPELLRYDACVPVTFGLDADPEAGIGRQTLPGGAYAVHTHVGSYAEAGPALLAAAPRDRAQARAVASTTTGRSWPIYLNDPAITREVHRRTELCVPVLPVRMPLSSNDDGRGLRGARGGIRPAEGGSPLEAADRRGT